jgi:transaldolase/glucose-6-phosphate isomerase
MSGGVGSGNFDGLGDLTPEVDAALEAWQQADNTRRLWDRDASLWTGQDEADWLGWLDIIEGQLSHMEPLNSAAEAARVEGFTDILLLGMGGSSLCPEVLRMTFGTASGFPDLHVLDSTDPAQVKAFEKQLDLERSVFIVSSKSGSTLEPNIFFEYFFDRVKERLGEETAGDHFIAITDPDSRLQRVAERERFRFIFHGIPSIGGRYSALSDFGMVPGAAMGIDVEHLLLQARSMAQACAPDVSAAENPGVRLGVTLGVAGKLGRDKVTLIASPGIADLGAWLEQLLAESTGKDGVALIPVDREALGGSGAYGDDRLFVYLRLADEADAGQDESVDWLEESGHPVIRIELEDRYAIGGEFFRWEFATAVAGSILGINPFNQPDVEASKVGARSLTDAYEETGALPAETPILEGDGLELYTDERNAKELAAAAGDKSIAAYLKAHLDRLGAGDYLGLLAYIEMNDAHEARLQSVRHRVRDVKRVATCLGFGPRFLHSTGQAYKGGPNTGVFLQITCDDAADIQVPGRSYTFGVVKSAQARGDFDVLSERGRRALRLHLGADVDAGLDVLRQIVDAAYD